MQRIKGVRLVDKEMLDKEVDNLARRYGKLVPADEVGERDMVMGEFSEVDGDIKNNSTISIEFVEDKTAKKQLIGKKVGDTIPLTRLKFHAENLTWQPCWASQKKKLPV